MVKILIVLFNRKESGEIPKQWQLATITSVKKKRIARKIKLKPDIVIYDESSIKNS